MKNLIAAVLFTVAASLGAQTYQGMTIPSTGGALGGGHPRLMFGTTALYSAAQTWYTANYASVNPGTCGDTTGISLVDACSNLAFKHAMNPSVDATAAINAGLAVMNQATAATPIVSCDIGGGDDVENSYHDCAELLVLIYDWTYDQMTPTQRAQYIAGGNVWFGPLQTSGPNENAGTIGFDCTFSGLDNNYCVSYTKAAFDWGIATYWEDTSIAQQNLDQWNTNWARYKTYRSKTTLANPSGGWQSAGAGGVYQEGGNYGEDAAAAWVIPTVTGNSLGRNIFTELPDFMAAPFWYIYNTTPSQTTTYNNLGTPTSATCYDMFMWNVLMATPCQAFLNPEPGDSQTNPFNIMGNLATYFSSVNVGEYAQEWINTVGSGSPIQVEFTPWAQAVMTTPTPIAYSSLPLDYFAPGAGFLYLRKAWDGGATTVASLNFNTQSEISHEQPWYGDWQMWRNGHWLSRNSAQYSGPDPTGWNGTSQTSIGLQFWNLNTLLINPNNQGCVAGSTCYDGGGMYFSEIGMLNDPPALSSDSAAQVSRLQDATNFAYAAVNISGVYGYSGCSSGVTGSLCNPAVNTVWREFVWFRDIETLVVFDRTLTNALGSVSAGSIIRTNMAHCEYAWTLVDAHHASCVDNGQELYLTVLLPSTPTPALEQVNEYTAWSDPNAQYRLEINDTPGTAQSYNAIVVQGMASSGTPLTPTISLSGGVYTIAVDANHSWQVSQGSASSGGSVTIDGTTTTLSSTVEPITVTNSGPVWGTASGFALNTATTNPGTLAGTNCPANGLSSGASYSCTASAESGYSLHTLSDTCGGTVSGNVDSGTVTNSCVVEASFVSGTTFNLTTSTSGSGSGTISGSNCPATGVASGTSYGCTATASGGSTFVSMTDGCGGTVSGNTTSGTITANCTVSAVFNSSSGPTYTLSTSVSPTGSGTLTGTNCPASGVASGSSYGCTASPASGYTFGSINDGCGGTVSGNATSGTIASNCTVSAVFNLVPASGPAMQGLGIGLIGIGVH